jgi:hypothetical protein
LARDTNKKLDYTDVAMKYKPLIGSKVRHGSPGYENEEIISRIRDKNDHVIVDFESGFFTKVKHKDIDFFVEHGSSDYIRHESNAFESMIFVESVCPVCLTKHL